MQVRWLVADIERCIFVLYCFGWAVLRRSFKPEQSPNKFVRCQVAPSMRFSMCPSRQRVVSRVGYALRMCLVVSATRHRRGCAAVRVDPGVRDVARASRHCNNRIVPQSIVEIRSAAAIVKDLSAAVITGLHSSTSHQQSNAAARHRRIRSPASNT